MPRVFISIGSNIDREHNIGSALRELQRCYAPLTLSPVYESQAVGFQGAPFLNLVVAFDTDEPLKTITAKLLEIEQVHGRVRDRPRFSGRTLDLDLLLYGDLVQHDRDVQLPRPDIREYAFVLKPLAEIAPHLHHPETNKTYEQLWQEFDQHGQALRRVNVALM